MKKRVSIIGEGKRADIGDYAINRLLPNRYIDAVGPFVFLDHLLPTKHSAEENTNTVDGTGSHPHRGIATLTYLLNGEADHYDSTGHHAKVYSGGVQWMKAGNGIVHDEAVNVDEHTNDHLTHALQFWINLPAKQKAEPPEYVPVQAGEVPRYILPGDAGWLKVIVGKYGNLVSVIPTYTDQFLFHIHLNGGKQFSMETIADWEYAEFLPLKGVTVNGVAYDKEELLFFERDNGSIEIINPEHAATDIILFGGEPYLEPIVAQGPFVMNTFQEIADAYKDFHAGKYGKISY